MARKQPAKSKRSEAARRGWKTRRENARKRSEAARRGWKTRRENDKLRKKKIGGAQPTRQKIRSISEWLALNFQNTEKIEIVANADY